MKKNPKTGDIVIPKIAWLCLAAAHAKVADDIAKVFMVHGDDGPLGDALRAMVLEHDARTDQYDRAAAAVKKGRPKVKPKITSNAMTAALLGIPYERKSKPKAKRGRPVSGKARSYDYITYLSVEKRREELARTNRSKATISAAIESFDMEMAGKFGRSPTAYAKDRRHSTRASYMRGRRLAAS